MLHHPYKDEQVDLVYNLLFCDDPFLFRTEDSPWPALFAEPMNEAELRRMADDNRFELRLRVLAFNRLQRAGKEVPKRQLLGVIFEAPMQQGLDTLAVYTDGSGRYINQSGKIVVMEGAPPPVIDKIIPVLNAAQLIVDNIGAWGRDRLPPPDTVGVMRMSFLVSDGLCFGEGPIANLQKDALAAPLLKAAGELLLAVVDTSLGAEQSR